MRRRDWRNGTVSAVGLGCMSFGGFYGPTTEAETMRAMARSLELGQDFWDTANVYGEGLSETLIGKFLAEHKSRRRKITLGTKFAIRRSPTGVRYYDNSAAHMR
ncbi:MAG: aldo/keto reductase, partial [Hyphomicrobiales bacterium]|nr:aldo/keto reductase [Hyphomicrobiales bacterium]